jgi:Uma2 family endonuclease
MVTQSQPLTYADLQRIRETRDERLELIDGELFVTPSPTPLHQRVSRRLNDLLGRAIDEVGAGEHFYAPLDVRLADGTVVQPDLVAVSATRFGIITESAIEGVPDFMVEIVSPSHDRHDREVKRALYARHMVPEYWLVDPGSGTITIYTEPHEGQYQSVTITGETAHSVTIPGLSVDVAALFAPVPAR